MCCMQFAQPWVGVAVNSPFRARPAFGVARTGCIVAYKATKAAPAVSSISSPRMSYLMDTTAASDHAARQLALCHWKCSVLGESHQVCLFTEISGDVLGRRHILRILWVRDSSAARYVQHHTPVGAVTLEEPVYRNALRHDPRSYDKISLPLKEC